MNTILAVLEAAEGPYTIVRIDLRDLNHIVNERLETFARFEDAVMAVHEHWKDTNPATKRRYAYRVVSTTNHQIYPPPPED